MKKSLNLDNIKINEKIKKYKIGDIIVYKKGWFELDIGEIGVALTDITLNYMHYNTVGVHSSVRYNYKRIRISYDRGWIIKQDYSDFEKYEE